MYQLVVHTMIYARKLQKERIKVFVSSLPSHYLHWTMLFCCRWKRGQCFLLSLEKKKMYFAVIGKKTKLFSVVGKEDNVFLLSL
jgi:hypothetical protein